MKKAKNHETKMHQYIDTNEVHHVNVNSFERNINKKEKQEIQMKNASKFLLFIY